MEPRLSAFHSSMGFGHRNEKSCDATQNGSARSYCQNSRDNVGVEFRTELKDIEESEACSPPLWTTSPARNAEYRKIHFRSLSPASRTQAIARGQQELMEMVKNMPESYYELTLRDLVEQPLVGAQENEPEDRSFHSESSHGTKENISSTKKFDRKVQKKRSGNINNGGFYIKMAFPTSLGSTKKKNSKRYDQFERNNISPKISPRAPVSDGSAKSAEREWYKSFSGSGNSESGVSSMNSGSTKSTASNSSSSSNNSNSYSSRYDNGGCWSFIFKSKPQVQDDN